MILRILFIVFLCSIFIESAAGCSCTSTNIKKSYFDASTTFFAIIRPVWTFQTETERFYQLKLIKQFKSCINHTYLLASTPLNAAACGVSLAIGTDYVLPLDTAMYATLDLCQFIREVGNLTEDEKRFLNTRQICCEQSCTCVDGNPLEHCLRSPCSHYKKPPCKEATMCVDNSCGGCVAEWFDKKGHPACEKTTAADSDAIRKI